MTEQNIPYDRIEFHRNALALMPESGDKTPGTAFFASDSVFGKEHIYCTCNPRKKTCSHIKQLSSICRSLKKEAMEKNLEISFKESIWHKLATALTDVYPIPLAAVRVSTTGSDIQVLNEKKDILLIYAPSESNAESIFPDSRIFIDRLKPDPDQPDTVSRFHALKQLVILTQNDNERVMASIGRQTRRQALENSLWYRMSYHFFRVYGNDAWFFAHVDEADGTFSIHAQNTEMNPFLVICPAKNHTCEFLAGFRDKLINADEMAVHPIPLKTVVHMKMTADLHLEMRPCLQVTDQNGKTAIYDREALEPFRFGTKWYLTGMKCFAEIQKPDPVFDKFEGKFQHVVPNKNIPALLSKFGDALWENAIMDESVKNMTVFKTADHVELFSHAIENDWYYLSVNYGFGDTHVSLLDILKAKKTGKRFISTSQGWVDCQSFDTDGFTQIPGMPVLDQFSDETNRFRMSRIDLFRLHAASDAPLNVSGEKNQVHQLNTILQMTPSEAFQDLKGMTSILRSYQKRGAEWLYFLYENGFGGLLCDDMGLGKTHQSMALLCWLKEKKQVTEPFLVVCPTTVLSHWQSKLSMHANGLNTAIYYGADRNIKTCLSSADVIITSYGVLRQDILKLKPHRFATAIFDEAQNLKNPGTQIYDAACNVNAAIKFGLTGTPLENNIKDIKALFDLTLPGYLGSDNAFDYRYVQPVMQQGSAKRKKELSRLISPFTLRRLKSAVLSELPPKIEDIRMCRLSDEQVKLYQDAISSKGKNLSDILKNGIEPIPYIHIFALLNLLKQICNHPAMLKENYNDYQKHESGKWEAFEELLLACIENNQKIVVYSQYLSMIGIIKTFLDSLGVHAVTLTGTTRNRGAVIEKFNTDPSCRVFVGSLKAGGVGIDLVAASVVIHYDRWWNAAKEDQATDRVHRIGQKRGVQVFKLVTEGTLEEKISAIIEKKRHLMDQIVQEDDPDLLKTFSREQLLYLLS
ncbi:MAG: DEAD/DEAH box helicase [Proteobacteria bacterium]|nr:DEAD/DEAH box helicase [Pseudomonadota bacterium]